MAKFLLEIYSEEIPARMQIDAVENMKNYTFDTLKKEKISIEKEQIKVFVSPRRIALLIDDLPKTQEIAASKIIGPKIDAPDKAVQGFLKSNNLTQTKDLDQIDHNNAKYFCYFKKGSQISTKNIIVESIDKIIAKMTNSWPKVMRYNSSNSSKIHKWIRPVRNILCLFDNEILNIELFGLKSNKSSFGHFLYSNQPVEITSIDQYQEILSKNFVIVDQNQRKKAIQDQIEEILKANNLSTTDHISSEIFKEINGICEFPTALLGKIDKKFMDLPHEILILTLKSNQKFICLKDSHGKLSQNFIFICDSPKAKLNHEKIINDNQKVAYARLQDASFYIEEDLKKSLEEHYQDLKNVIFHDKLGNFKEKSKRIEVIAEFLSLWIPHCPIALINETARFCKADLTMKTVAEFTSLQGNIGSYCAKKQGYDPKICEAIKEHYLPTGNNAAIPKTPLGAAISIADKTDNIVGFFLAGQKPTSSKDPYALRRSAIGILRICISHNIQVPFKALISRSLKLYKPQVIRELLNESDEDSKNSTKRKVLTEDVVKFFIEKLKNILKEDYGYSTDIVNNIIDDYIDNLKDHKYCDIIKLINRISFVNSLVNDKSNLELIEIYKRSVNVLGIEEKKDDTKYNSKPHLLTLKQKEEKDLYRTIRNITPTFRKMIKKGDYQNAFEQLKRLHEPLTKFFDNVMVNDENEKLRHNRLLILSTIRKLFSMVADLSNIEIRR